MILRYIDSVAGDREGDGLRWGVESICAQLTQSGAPSTPSTYCEHRGRPATNRKARDAELKPAIGRAHAQTYGVYGARIVWLALNRGRPAGRFRSPDGPWDGSCANSDYEQRSGQG